MYKVLLKETEKKTETIVDFDEILAFNEREIHFKCDKYLNSCKEWHEQLKDFAKRLTQSVVVK